LNIKFWRIWMDLGEFYPCLNVKNIEQSINFYLKLGFRIIEDHREENWAVLQHNNMALSLYQGHIKENLINFRGGDIPAIVTEATENGLAFDQSAEEYADGSWNAEIRDPDGNVIFFDTSPDERKKYVRAGKLIDY